MQIVNNLKSKFVKLKNIKFNKNLIFLLAFIIPVFIMVIIYMARKIYPLGPNCFLRTDMYHQYAPFFSEFYGKLKNGRSLAYSWNIGLGVNFTALYAYYLASPSNWLIFLCPKEYIIEFMSILIILKIALASLSFAFYLSRHFNTKNMALVIFSIFYGLSSYIAAYSWNIMWLDCIVLLPLITLGLELLVKQNKCLLYCISLGISIISNYYISIMICLFLIFYFFILISVDKGSYKAKFKKILNFGIFSLLAGGLAAVLIIPEFFALQLSTSGNIDFPNKLSTYFKLFDMFSRHLVNIETSVLSGNFPNIYCGIIVIVMIPLYIMNKSINSKEKLLKLLLLVLFVISFNMNMLNFIWHGFHFPNSLPCRQSYIYIFLILSLSYESFLGLKNAESDLYNTYTDKQVYGSFWGVILFILCVEKLMDNYDYVVIYLSLMFIIAYFIIIYLYRSKKLRWGITMFLLVFITSLEAGINTEGTSVSTTNRQNYIKDNKPINELIDQISDEDKSFFRVEKLYRRTKNDTAWHNIRGVSLFSSTANEGVTNFLGDLGFMHSTNAYSYEGATPLTTSILSVKYLINKEKLEDNDLLELYKQDNENDTYIYKNKFWLPLGFIVNKATETLPSTLNNPFSIQNDFVNRAVKSPPIFIPLEAETRNNTTTIYNDKTQRVYVYIQSTNVEKIKVQYDGIFKEYDLDKKQQIVDLGVCDKNKVIEVKNSEADKSLKLIAYGFNEDNFKLAYSGLNKNPLVIDYFNDTTIEGKISVDEAGLLFTSIPYDKGWKVKVDSKDVELIPFKDAFIMLDIAKGDHTIEFKYKPEGLNIGIALSSLSLVIIILIAIYKLKNQIYSHKSL